MKRIREVNEMLMAVGRRDGVFDLQLSPSGCVGLQLKQGCRLHFEWVESDQALCLYTPLFLIEDIPEKARLALCLDLLAINNFSSMATVVFVKERGEVLLQTMMFFDLLTVQFLDATIDRFLSSRAEVLERVQHMFVD